MSYLLMLFAAYATATDQHDDALIAALLALTYAVLRVGRRGWLAHEWEAAMRRADGDGSTLFEGRRDDDR